MRATEASLQEEYGRFETELSISLEAEPLPQTGGGASAGNSPLQPRDCLDAASAAQLLALLQALPHGVAKFSHAVPGLVETSNNLASVKQVGGWL